MADAAHSEPNRPEVGRTFSVRRLAHGRNGSGAFWSKAMSDDLHGVAVGQVRRARYTHRHFVVMWIEPRKGRQPARVLVGQKGMPWNDLSWDTPERIATWRLVSDAYPPTSNRPHGPASPASTSPESH